ncbi:MAG: hypothetical protein AABY49_07995 [Planctomycetota bacterium]
MKMKNMFTKYLLWVALAAPLSGAGCVTVSTEYVDSRIDKSIRELEERIKQENSTDVDAVIAKMKGAESAVIKQVVTALTNALDAKKIAIKAQESAEDANVKAVDALDSVTGAVASIDQFTKDVAEVKKIADNALEKTSNADARIAEALKAATQAATVAVRSLELTSDTRPVAINAMSYALKTPLISNSAEIANN